MCTHYPPRLLAAGLAALLLGSGSTLLPRVAAAQAAAQPAARVEPGLTLEVEGFCSETRLRTSNARITWRAQATVLGAGVASLDAAPQRLETTVFKGGFEKGLYVALPIGDAVADRPIAAIAPGVPGVAGAAQQTLTRRAYQIRLITVNAARASAAAADTSEMDAVVENLEPGVNYTWRMAVDVAAGRIVSPLVSLRALVCPADMVEPPPTQTPRRQP
jgi:hypothetical protein